MAEHGSRDFWRTRCEQLVASGMKVHEWCAPNHVHAASMHEWLKRFHQEDPSMFDGIGLPEGMEGYGRGWYEAVRKAYADAHAIVPQRLSAASFAVVPAATIEVAARLRSMCVPKSPTPASLAWPRREFRIWGRLMGSPRCDLLRRKMARLAPLGRWWHT